MSGVLLSTAAWPNLHYFIYLLGNRPVVIEQHDTFGKQSYRNRYEILSANGVLPLTVPVHRQNHSKTREVRISYTEDWQTRHWRALTSAYKKSPYFDHFEDEVRNTLFKKTEFLLQYNLSHLGAISRLLRRPLPVTLSRDYDKATDLTDLREMIHPKKKFGEDGSVADALNQSYYQTFGDKYGFVANLSILDLLFNAGPGALQYLRSD
jgi:hypothetical protein